MLRILLLFFLCPDEATEDLLSLMTLLDHWVLDVNSPDYSLGDVEGWIGKRAGCKETGASRHYVLEASGPSAPVLLHWHQITAFQGQLSIHARWGRSEGTLGWLSPGGDVSNLPVVSLPLVTSQRAVSLWLTCSQMWRKQKKKKN